MRSAFRFVVPAAVVALMSVVPSVSADDPAASHGLAATYFDNPDLTGASVARIDPAIDFRWEGVAPLAGIASHTFSIRWTGKVTPRYSERYTFSTTSDDGIRVWVDGQQIIDDWTDHQAHDNTGQITLEAGRAYDLRVEFYEDMGRAEAHLRWRSASQPDEIVPTERLQPSAPTGPTAPASLPVATTPTAVVPVPVPAGVTGVTGATGATGPVAAPAAIPVAELPPPSTPVAGETFDAAPVRGTVLIRAADGSLQQLGDAATLPVGARLDTRDGAVRIDTAKAKGVKHPKQFARLSGGMFSVAQQAAGNRVVTLQLLHGDFESCVAPSLAAPAAGLAAQFARPVAAKSGTKVRELWGHGKGRFRTVGRGAAATVRGTFWNVEDTCDATTVRVREGVVGVEDFATGREITLTKGESYTAPIKPRGR